MPLPVPQLYDDWRDWASALMQTLGAGDQDIAAGSAQTSGTSGTVTTPPPPTEWVPPAGWFPIWMNFTTSELATGNVLGSPPTSPDIVFIDTANIADAAIETAKIASGAVTTGLISVNGVTTLNVAAANIVTAKIANAAIVSALIGNLQVVTAAIANLAVNNAQIANLAVGTANIQALAVNQAKIAALSVGAAQIINLAVGTAQIGLLAVTAAQIANATIGTAQIANAAIGTALIQTAAIVQALIATAAVGSAQIQNLAVTNAKIADLVFDKLTAGTLNAVVDMGTGLIRFTIGGNKLVLGKGFGTASQFIMWFGPDMAENLMSEYNAVFYLKTDGSAYFGGSLLAGTLTNSAQTTNLSHTASVETGPFGSNGGTRTYTVSYQDNQSLDWTTGSMTATGTYDATLVLEADYGAGFVALGSSHTFTGSNTIDNTDKTYRALISGSFTYTDTSGGLGPINVRARLTGRNDYTLGGGFGGTGSFFESQRIGIVSVEP